MADLLQIFLIGVVSSYGACLVSCWPIALPFVTAADEGWRKRLQSALIFLFAKLIVYTAAGFAAAALGRILTGWLKVHGEALFITAGLAIIFLGLRAALTGTHPCGALFRHIKPGQGLASPALLGLFAGIIPCATSVAVTAYIALSAETPLFGAALGLSFGAGKFFSPLIPAALLVSYVEGRLKINRIWMRWGCGLLVCIMGLRLIL